MINTVSNAALPVIEWAGDVVSWPVRAVGDIITGIRELSTIKSKNDELTLELLETRKKQNEYDIAIAENQILRQQLDIIKSFDQGAIYAKISYDNTAFHSSYFFINKGENQGIEKNMIVLSFEKQLLGVVLDVGANYAKVQGLNDVKSKIPVQFTGSEIYGFLVGNGTNQPEMEFISDTEFQPTSNLNITTKSIHGIMPDGIFVGTTINSKSVKVLKPNDVSNVMVLKFNDGDKYK